MPLFDDADDDATQMILSGMARAMTQILPARFKFVVMLVPVGDTTTAFVASSLSREGVVEAMKEFIENQEPEIVQ